MNTQAEATLSIADVIKQVFSGIVLISGLVAFYYFSEIQLLYRVLGLVLVVLISLGLVLTTDMGQSVWSFILESKIEVRKVVWPTRDETTRTTLLVFAMVFAVGFILWLLDMFLFWGVRFITGQGG